MAERRAGIDYLLALMMDDELYLRKHQDDSSRREKPTIYYKRMEDMTPQEIDSLKRLPSGGDTILVSEAREKRMGGTTAEIEEQMMQELAMKRGLFPDINTLDSLFTDSIKGRFAYRILFYGRDTLVTDSVGKLRSLHPKYASGILPIGTTGRMYIQLKADIPLAGFVVRQIGPLLLSVCMMLFVVACLAYHLVVIRRKERLLQKREESINGTIHDLKAPLNSVVATLGWIEAGETSVAKKKAVGISLAEVKHLVCNIESLLVTVRKDRKKLVLQKQEMDILRIAELVKSSMDALYRTKPHEIEIINNLPPALKVEADGMYIENVVRNLVENALKYSDDGVRVKVRLSVSGKMLHVAVEDNGWGIAPKYRKKLFRQFYQVPRSKERMRKGYGIGLVQSKYIVEEHQGRMEVESTEGKGSVFSFAIPLA